MNVERLIQKHDAESLLASLTREARRRGEAVMTAVFLEAAAENLAGELEELLPAARAHLVRVAEAFDETDGQVTMLEETRANLAAELGRDRCVRTTGDERDQATVTQELAEAMEALRIGQAQRQACEAGREAAGKRVETILTMLKALAEVSAPDKAEVAIFAEVLVGGHRDPD